jgi:hypothetical protein
MTGMKQTRSRMGLCLTMALVAIAATAVWVIPVTAEASAGHAASAPVHRCGFLRASVPYSHHGNRHRWGVYVTGSASCRSAQRTLNAVMHLGATAHNGSSSADSYFTYRDWRCDFGQMGAQNCWTPSRRPYRAQALALTCDKRLNSGGCPATVSRESFG